MSKEVLLGTVVPVLGGLVAIVMYASPLKACYTARQQQQLGVRQTEIVISCKQCVARNLTHPKPVCRSSIRCRLQSPLPAQRAGMPMVLQHQVNPAHPQPLQGFTQSSCSAVVRAGF